jgi:PAS domain S-box-containing protein
MSFQYNDFALFANFPNPVFLLSPDGTVLEANRFFVEKYFSHLGDIRGKNIYELTSEALHSPEFSAKRKANVDSVVASGKHLIFDDDFAEGGVFRSSIYPVTSSDGAVTSVLVIVHDITEQIASEKQARHTDLIYQTLLNAVPGSVFVLDNEFHLISCNSVAFDLFGDRNGQINNNDFLHLFVSEEQPRIKKLLADLMQSGIEKSEHVKMNTHEDRKNFNWFNLNARKTFIENHNYIVIVCIDISELKHSEMHLAEYKRWLTKSMDAGNTGVWDWNIVTNTALWSSRTWDIFGINRVPGQYPDFQLWKTAVHPDDREMVVESLQRAVTLLADLKLEYRIVHPDNSVHWILVTGKPLYNKHGEIKRYSGTIVDITDQKLFEDETLKIREHLDVLLEKFNIGWFHLNLKDHSAIRTIEHAKIFGYENLFSDWSLEKFLEHIIDEDRERIRTLVFDSISNNKDYATECWIRKTDGEKRKIWASGSLVLDEHGKPAHVVGIIQDITDRKTR